MESNEIGSEEGGHAELNIKVDGGEIRFHHAIVSGREVLEAAGKLPPDDFIVYWLGKDNVLEDLGLDRTVHLHGFRVWLERRDEPDRLIARGESVDLSAPGIERFYLDRMYSVEIVNEENGDEFVLEAAKNTKIETLLTAMYARLGVPRRGDDRLRCEETGEDVFGFAHLTVGQYLEAGHCACLVWCFVGGTGGAVCR